MKALMICASAPTRDHPRTHGFIAALARAGHAVTLIFVDRAGTAFDDLADRCERTVPVHRPRELIEVVRAELGANPYDLVHVDGPAAPLIDGPLGLPTVVDGAACGLMRRERAARAATPLIRAARVVQAGRARRFVGAARALSARMIIATPDDRWAYTTLGYEADALHVVPSLIDLERFAPPARLREQATLLLDLRGLDQAEAMDALSLTRTIMAEVWAQRSDVGLTVLGQPTFGTAGHLATDGRVIFTGPVSDPRGHLAAATLALVPVVPGGSPPHAPLEAMATATPVLACPALACDLEAAPGHELAIASSVEGWSRMALALLDDAPYRGRLGRAGRHLVELRHGPRPVINALENVYAATVGSAIARWRLEVGLDRLHPEE